MWSEGVSGCVDVHKHQGRSISLFMHHFEIRIYVKLVSVWTSQVALVVKNPPTNARDVRDSGSIPGWGRSPGGGHGNPLQYSCLENPMDRGAWRAAVHGVTKSRRGLKWLSTNLQCLACLRDPALRHAPVTCYKSRKVKVSSLSCPCFPAPSGRVSPNSAVSGGTCVGTLSQYLICWSSCLTSILGRSAFCSLSVLLRWTEGENEQV